MPKEEKKEKKEKNHVQPNVLYPCQSRFAYKTDLGLFIISFKLKNILPNTITYIVRIFLHISENETKFIKEFSFNSLLKDNKIVKLIRQISNNNFNHCPHDYAEFNANVAKEILGLIKSNSSKNAILGAEAPASNVTLVSSSPTTGSPQSGLSITSGGVQYKTSSTKDAYVKGYSPGYSSNLTIPQSQPIT